MKKVILIASLLLCLITLSAQSKDHDKLRKELSQWQQIRAEGIIQVNYQMFSFRKLFVLSSAQQQIRLDIFDGGMFGMTPEPLFSAYAGDYVAVRSPVMPQLEVIAASKPMEIQPTQLLGQFDSIFELYADEIIANKELNVNGTIYLFDKHFRLTQATNEEMKIAIKIDYKRNKDPDKIVVRYENNDIITFLIDKISHEKVEIVPLPPNLLPIAPSDDTEWEDADQLD
ncbi:MAG: hypothetical protein CVU48_06335 [Candidatus Cloacimonetes bacterium HGW-Cloacimonetes-1]|jgi:hypothetical protein|nr:MAG: hypothetical protein CVU48_06335 [Candidatus Cloacimonetes bacterium HGW-Cloacimonetes-1]